MPTLNDFGDAAVARVEQQAQQIARLWNVPKEAIYGYFNETAHFPQTTQELEQWGNQPTKYGVTRRDPATGAWHPIMPGVNPDPRLSAQDRGGFPHNITNAEDSQIQRFQQVDQNGSVFGGSWNAALNAQHPEWAGKTGIETLLGSGGGAATMPYHAGDARLQIQGGRSAQGFDPNNYVAPVDPSNPSGPYVSVVNGQTNTFATQNEAENDYNARSGAGPSQGAPSVGAPAPGGAGVGASPSTGAAPSATGANPLFNPSAASAANAAVLAFLEQRRIDEIEKPELALKTQTELAQMRRDDALAVWKQAYEKATLTGTIDGQNTVDVGKAIGAINGTPTLEATRQQADLTGYTGQGYAASAQAAFANLPPEQRTGAAAARIWQNVVPGLSADEAAAMNEAGHQYYAANGQVMPDAVAAQNLARITGGRITGTGAQATTAYQHQQNQDAISALTLLSNLRGPENAFAYANTLANLPDSVRQAIAAAQQNLPTAYGPRNPAQAGLLADVGAPAAVSGQDFGTGPGTAVGSRLPAATGPRTAMTPDLVAAPGVGAMPVLRTAAVQPGPTQQTQPYLRMDPATQARIGASTGVPTGVPTGTELSGGPVAARPILTAGPGAGNGRTLPTPAGSDFGMAAGGVGGAPRTLPIPRGGDFGGTTPVYGGAPPVAYGPRTQPAGPRLPFAANQLSPTDVNATDPYAQKLMWAGYENAGGDISSGQWQYQNSLPKAYGPRTGRLRAA